jgi:hypothetical protein
MPDKDEYIQMWSPDTCGCVIHQAVDRNTLYTDDVQIRYVSPEEAANIFETHKNRHPDRAHKISKEAWAAMCPAQLCDAHGEHGHTKKRYAVVVEENQRKNHVVNLLAEKLSAKASEISFKFDKGRVLSVAHASLTAAVRDAVMPEIEAKHGKGKVILNG